MAIFRGTLSRVRRALRGRYKVRREIARGGMARIYLAEQIHPRRTVALKVLEPRRARGVSRERFLREVEYGARLAHPHIVPVFDAGHADDLLYFTMPFLPKGTLRKPLFERGAMDIERVLPIIREVGQALEYAHGQGVIHRDVKPENILLSQRHALVADFGVAAALTDDRPRLTLDGRRVGTPAYMSPEQMRGGSVDHRTDVFSLGLVTWELLAGHLPARDARGAVLYEEGVNDETDVDLVRFRGVLRRALARDPAERFASVTDLLSALGMPPADTPNPTDVRHVESPAAATRDVGEARGGALAVLPFDLMSSEPSDESALAQGLADDVRTVIARSTSLDVRSRTSVATYGGAAPAAVGHALGAEYLVTGSVRRRGDRVRIVTQLLRSSDARVLWAESFDRKLGDPLDLQDELAGIIGRTVAEVLDDTARVPAGHPSR